MSYYLAKTLTKPFQATVDRVVEVLATEGFGVLTTIDVQQTLKQKLNVDRPAYRIIGACNPKFADQALQMEDKIGTMLPCNVIVHDVGGGRTEVATIDPVAAMAGAANAELSKIAVQVRQKLENVLEKL